MISVTSKPWQSQYTFNMEIVPGLGTVARDVAIIKCPLLWHSSGISVALVELVRVLCNYYSKQLSHSSWHLLSVIIIQSVS